MSNVRVVVYPFLNDGTVGSDPVEITSDLILSGLKIKQKIDLTQYGVGVFRFDDVTLTLRNDHGYYSDADFEDSIFNFKRRDTLVEIYWEPGLDGLYCGFFDAGDPTAYISELDFSTKAGIVFSGIINDETSSTKDEDQTISFRVLGLEALYDRVLFSNPLFATDLDTMLYNLSNQSPITDYCTVDASNFNTATNITPDAVDDLRGTKGTEGLKRMLFLGNSVLTIDPTTKAIIVKPRTTLGSVKTVFYGSGSSSGMENFIDINNFNAGLSKTYNVWVWGSANPYNASSDSTSIATYNRRTQEISDEMISDTSTAKQTTILNSYLAEFQNPKQEFKLTAPMTDTNKDIQVLDQVQLNSPQPLFVEEGAAITTFGTGVYEVDRYPYELGVSEIDDDSNFKVIEREIDVVSDMIVFTLRQV